MTILILFLFAALAFAICVILHHTGNLNADGIAFFCGMMLGLLASIIIGAACSPSTDEKPKSDKAPAVEAKAEPSR